MCNYNCAPPNACVTLQGAEPCQILYVCIIISASSKMAFLYWITFILNYLKERYCTYSPLSTLYVYVCRLPMCVSGCLCACPYVVTSAVTKETPWGGEEVPKGVRHGEERHVVHSLSLEKGLSEIHRLIKSPSSVCDMSSSPLGATARWTLPLRK